MWRKGLRKAAARNPELQEKLTAACRSSFHFFCNAFLWTYRQNYVNKDGRKVPTSGFESHQPFITWPVQDEGADVIIDCIENGYSANIEKSRDMGVSWLTLAVFDWMFMFRSDVNFGLVSRKEDYVDQLGNMDSLFEKLRYMHSKMPVWLSPKVRARYMYIGNILNGSSFSGESTNADVGRGGRRTAYLVDEAAAIRNAEQVESSLAENTACQIWVSTPRGPRTAFHKRIIDGRGVHISFPWWRHPEKAHKAKQFVNDEGKVKWTSPWYERLPEEFSPKTIAQEVDMDHGKSGDLFFDTDSIQQHIQQFGKSPLYEGDLIFTQDMSESSQIRVLKSCVSDVSKSIVFVNGYDKKPWKLWIKLVDGRPPQDRAYAMGIDISGGTGGSNSVITVADTESKSVVAKFVSAFTSPEHLAMIAAMAGIWFGGARGFALIAWENNGPGGIFGRKITKIIGYPSCYRQRVMNTKEERRTSKFGWHSTPEKKSMLLGTYRDAISSHSFVNPCVEALVEAQEYIYDQSGVPIPARLLEDKTSGASAIHGDHVIADGICWMALQEIKNVKIGKMPAPEGSFAWRQQMRIQQRNKER